MATRRRRSPPRLFRRGTRWRRFQLGLALLIPVLAFGTCGYMLVGLGPFDALYQTAITISTVGYGEIGPEDEVDRAYRAFTLLLVFVGASSAVYTATVLLETLVEGSLDQGIRRRRMQRRIDEMSDHNPAATRTLAAGDVLIAVGSAVQLEHLATATAPPA